MSAGAGGSERRYVRLGLAALLLIAALGYVVFLYLGGAFRSSYRVDAIFDRAGQNLRDGSDVKLRGVLVGSVTRTEVTPSGEARVVMAMFPSQRIPANVHAAIRAKTLFGEKYVELRTPDVATTQTLAAGDVIPTNRTVEPFEVEAILERAVPLLRAVDPAELAAALDALVKGVVGNEDALRRATVQGERALRETEQTLPELERDLRHLDTFSRALDEADRDLLRALANLERAGGPVVGRRADLEKVLASLPGLTRDLADLLRHRERDLATLSDDGALVLEHVAAKAPELPKLADVLDGFLGSWISDLSYGPYWRIFVQGFVPCNPSTRCGPYGPALPAPRPAVTTSDAPRTSAGEDGAAGVAPEREGPVRRLADLLHAPLPGLPPLDDPEVVRP